LQGKKSPDWRFFRILCAKRNKLLAACCVCFFLVACGIEDYPYLYPVAQGDITQVMNSRAIIYIDGRNDSPSSTLGNVHYIIYYRIYVSGVTENSPSVGNFANINQNLAQDYAVIASYINSTTMGSSTIGGVFSSRRYYPLELTGTNIDNVLSPSQRTITLEFPQSLTPELPRPYLTNSSPTGTYDLYRSTGNNLFTPKPADRYFLNTDELNKSENITSNTNADVTDKSDASPRYTYAAFFIVAAGIDLSTYSQIYSTPAFVGVLRLPDSSS
jgi:hypothetical protein